MPVASDYGLPERPACAFCEGLETELHSPFGTALSVATYWCLDCRTAFEWVKWDAPDPAGQGMPDQEADA
jgi:hypothetical protein